MLSPEIELLIIADRKLHMGGGTLPFFLVYLEISLVSSSTFMLSTGTLNAVRETLKHILSWLGSSCLLMFEVSNLTHIRFIGVNVSVCRYFICCKRKWFEIFVPRREQMRWRVGRSSYGYKVLGKGWFFCYCSFLFSQSENDVALPTAHQLRAPLLQYRHNSTDCRQITIENNIPSGWGCQF